MMLEVSKPTHYEVSVKDLNFVIERINDLANIEDELLRERGYGMYAALTYLHLPTKKDSAPTKATESNENVQSDFTWEQIAGQVADLKKENDDLKKRKQILMDYLRQIECGPDRAAVASIMGEILYPEDSND